MASAKQRRNCFEVVVGSRETIRHFTDMSESGTISSTLGYESSNATVASNGGVAARVMEGDSIERICPGLTRGMLHEVQ